MAFVNAGGMGPFQHNWPIIVQCSKAIKGSIFKWECTYILRDQRYIN